jgi:cyclic-di-GMP-binding protein
LHKLKILDVPDSGETMTVYSGKQELCMPSVDVVSEIDMQEVDNAVNTVLKELANRYDFRGSKTEVELNKKDKAIKIVVEDTMKLKAVKEMLVGRFIARKLSPKVLDFGTEETATLGNIRVNVKLREGLTGDDARKVTKLVKDSKLKVQASVQGDQVRLSGNKIDDLQAIMQSLRDDESITVPLQFTNMKK